jgi:DNA primase
MVSKTQVSQIKQEVNIVDYIRLRGIELRKKGQQFIGLCPFHNDREPSLIVDEKKALWNCLGACSEGGDIYNFVMKIDKVSFPEAHNILVSKTEVKQSNKPDSKISDNIQFPKLNEQLTKNELEWLERVTTYYHSCLLRGEKAIAYLKKRGITAPEAITAFRLGFVDGTLPSKLNAEGREMLQHLGVLNKDGKETMRGQVVFPLQNIQSRQIINLYGRHITRRQHFYLREMSRSIFNPQGAIETEEVILTESIIDALALWCLGIRNVIPVYGVNGLAEGILQHLADNRVKRVVLMLDADDAARKAAKTMADKITALGIEVRAIELPNAKDASEFVTQGGTLEEVRQILRQLSSLSFFDSDNQSDQLKIENQSQPAAAFDSQVPSKIETISSNDGTHLFTVAEREYMVKGLSPTGVQRLKVNVRLDVGNNFHLDTFDLYQSSRRQTFAQMAAKSCRIAENKVLADLLALINELEILRVQMRSKGETPAEQLPMTEQERDAALEFLRDPKLLDQIVTDVLKSGLVADRVVILTSYLASISRKLNDPLALLIISRSGAGKSALQDAVRFFAPPADVVHVTRLTGQALFYKDSHSLQHKMFSIAEEEGAQSAAYSLRTLASDQRLTNAATRTDPNTGKMITEHYEVLGPVFIVTTTTSAEAFDEETRSRFVQVTMDESTEQTERIQVRQRYRHTLAGVIEQMTVKKIMRLHHNAQQLLHPLAVVNPFAEYLTFPSGRLMYRREHKKYLSLINSIALLHQHQREIKREVQGDIEVEYVEVTLDDIELANELAMVVLSCTLDELSPPVRGLLEKIEKACQEIAQDKGCQPEDVKLTRREIREKTGFKPHQVREYCKELVELEYLLFINNGNGRASQYQLLRSENANTESLRGLTDVAELRRKFGEQKG